MGQGNDGQGNQEKTTGARPLVVIDGLFEFGARRAVESYRFHEEYLARSSAKTEAAG